MSRATFEAPTTRPLESLIGDTVSEISSLRPSFVWRTVSKWSTFSPRLIWLKILSSSSRRSSGMIRRIEQLKFGAGVEGGAYASSDRL
jgi:hypothetical protein